MDGRRMNNRLPEAFTDRMREQLGDELTAFLHTMEEAPCRGIRIHPYKKTSAADIYTDEAKIPWVRDAYYLPAESSAGATAIHEAGGFYIQDPGAMLPAAVLNALPGENVLDLCAAPGGKSTQIGCDMQGEGLLVCNEPVPKRAQILSRNIERMGIPNSIVTCAWPEQLAEKWHGCFDAVLADAPCSGEGMFRKEPETRNEWSSEKAAGCASRQREILSAAALLVRPGGRLIYSTCTYNPEENERNAAWFLEQFRDFEPEAFKLPGIEAPDGMFTCYPHRLRCEGQFVAKFRKRGQGEEKTWCGSALPVPPDDEAGVFRRAFPALPAPTHRYGNTLVRIARCPDLRTIRTFRVGLHLGEVRGKIAVPDHAAAMAFPAPEMKWTNLTPDEAVQYLAGEAIPGESEGWTLMRYQGLVLGWGKGSEGMIRNHYPKGLRRTHLLP